MNQEIIPLPPFALEIIEALEDEGHQTWADGGYVRNCLAQRHAGHLTFATNAPTETITRLFRGRGFDAQPDPSNPFSVTILLGTPGEKPIQIHRFHQVIERDRTGKPLSFAHVDTIQEDLARRDFTFNALAWHPERGLVDPYRGARDIRNATIRCVGDARLLMSTEPLCSLRALRFASTMGFSADETTLQALKLEAHRLPTLDALALRHQVEKLLCGPFVRETLMDYIDVLGAILPELLPMRNFDQLSRFHCYDVLEHTAYVVSHSKAYAFNRWAALLHDTGKPETFVIDKQGRGHMPGHPEASIDHLKNVAARMRFSSQLTHELELVIRHHDDRPAATEEDVRRLYANLENNERLFHAICDLMRADSLSKASFCQMERVIITNEVEELFEHMLNEGKL